MMYSSKLIGFLECISITLVQLSCFSVENAKAFEFDYEYEYNQNHAKPRSGSNYCPCSDHVQIKGLLNGKRFKLAEEPFYDAGSVYFVDAFAMTVNRYCIRTDTYYYAEIGNETVSVIIPIKGKPGKFLITSGDYLAILTWNGVSRTASYEKIIKVDPSRPWPAFFLDDAKIAPRNKALFVYNVPRILSVESIPRNGSSTLFSYLRGKRKALIRDLDFGNGLGWNCAGDEFYHSDTARNCTYKSFYNQKTNSVENTVVLLNYTEAKIGGFPDSLTVDADGFVLGVCNGVGKIIKIDPRNGRVVCTIQLPSTTITNLALGACPGSSTCALDCIYATTSSAIGVNKYDGVFFLIRGSGSRGVYPDKLQLSAVFGSNRIRYSD